jgi:hypothetical protein
MRYCWLAGEGGRGRALWFVLVYSLCEGVWQTLRELLYILKNVNAWGEEIKIDKELYIPVKLRLKEFGLFNSSEFEAVLRTGGFK